MVDVGWVRTAAHTWQASRWPLPKPALIRKNSQLRDTQGRDYVRMSKENALKLGLQLNGRWWWYALPIPSKRSEKIGQPLAVGERITMQSARRVRVRSIGWAIERNRAVGIIAMS